MNKTKSKIKRFLYGYEKGFMTKLEPELFLPFVANKKYQRRYNLYKIIYINYISVLDEMVGMKNNKLDVQKKKIIRILNTK